MSVTLSEILDIKRPNTDSVLHATRYFLAEKFGDVPPSEMRESLLDAGISNAELNSALGELETDLASIEQGSLLILSEAIAQNSDDGETVRAAFDEASTKLPILETAILALVVMYGLYLLTPASDKPVRIVTRKTIKKDGSVETSKDASYHEPTNVLRAVVDLVTRAKSRESNSKD